MDRYEAIKRFEFVRNLYDRSDNAGFVRMYRDESDGGGIVVCKSDPIRLCGVVMYGNYAYVSNNVFLGKARINDGIDFKGLFWNYDVPDDEHRITRDSGYKIPLSGVVNSGPDQKMLFYNYDTGMVTVPEYMSFLRENIKALNSNFFKWRDNYIKVRSRDITDLFLNLFGRGYGKKKLHFCEIEVADRKSVSITTRQKSERRGSMGFSKRVVIPAYIPKETYENWQRTHGKFSVCCLELDEIAKAMQQKDDCGFEGFDKLVLAYDENPDIPLVIKGNDHDNSAPDIRFALAQYVRE